MEAGRTPTPVPPTPEEELLALRESVEELDRKVSTRFYALAAATVLALAAGIVGIVLTLGLKDDAATNQDLRELRDEVAGVERSASEAADDDLAALGDRVTDLESQIQGLRSDQDGTDTEISVLQDDIAELRDDLAAAQSAANDSGPNDSE